MKLFKVTYQGKSKVINESELEVLSRLQERIELIAEATGQKVERLIVEPLGSSELTQNDYLNLTSWDCSKELIQ